ncbi:MAG: LytTR family transcriptional regulator DNA-binding domain-containing protein [Caulobacteraceae bacterium]|nr:LytTR family transcriptional regulator DNA-binding domain-containing protein [Caulobacteraceae bacterium]
MTSALSLSQARTLRGLGVALAGGVVLAFTGAFGTGETPIWLRLAYWCFVMLAGALWGTVASKLVELVVDYDERPWPAAAALTAVITLPMTAFVWLVTGLIFVGRAYPPEAFVHLLGPVALVTGTISVLNVFLGRPSVQTHVAPGPSPERARFLDRLPARLRGARLIAVQAEDHYLRLHTDRGSDLILMRLSDALAELEGLEGAQTHRSWWVARDAVRDVDRGDGRASLTLDGGLTAPVSRRHARALRAAGWW